MARARIAEQGQLYSFEAFEQGFLKALPNSVGRVGAVAEIADAAAFLSRPRAAFFNGRRFAWTADRCRLRPEPHAKAEAVDSGGDRLCKLRDFGRSRPRSARNSQL